MRVYFWFGKAKLWLLGYNWTIALWEGLSEWSLSGNKFSQQQHLTPELQLDKQGKSVFKLAPT